MKFTQSYTPRLRSPRADGADEGGRRHRRDGDERKPITHYYDDAVEASVPAQ